MPTIRFHQTVQTPNGPGIVQGRCHIHLDDGAIQERIIISHPKNMPTQAADQSRLTSGKINGIWHLYHYDPQELTPL